MFGNDLLISFGIMTILFLRQISIMKQANKINYAPLMIGIGLISSIVHFIIHPEAQNFVLLLRESFFPLLVSLLLFIVMNIMHQTKEREVEKTQYEFSRVLVKQITELKIFMGELEERMNKCQLEDREAQEGIRQDFIQDIKALEAIKTNQLTFLEKFEEMDAWHERVSDKFDNFTNIQLPKINTIIHEHIDILRIAEQDHYNKIKNILELAGNSRIEIAQDMDNVKENLRSMKGVADSIADSITKSTLEKLSGVTHSFENEIGFLKSRSEGISTSLQESESTLSGIREKSEMIMQQMVLSSNKMQELQEQNTSLHNIYTTIKELMVDMEIVKADYVKSQAQLSQISKEMNISKDEQMQEVQKQMQKIEETLIELHVSNRIIQEDNKSNVQILAKQAQLQRGYTELDK